MAVIIIIQKYMYIYATQNGFRIGINFLLILLCGLIKVQGEESSVVLGGRKCQIQVHGYINSCFTEYRQFTSCGKRNHKISV